MSGWILISDSVFTVSVAMLFWLKYVKKNPASHRYIVGKERSVFKGFIGNYGCFSLILYQN